MMDTPLILSTTYLLRDYIPDEYGLFGNLCHFGRWSFYLEIVIRITSFIYDNIVKSYELLIIVIFFRINWLFLCFCVDRVIIRKEFFEYNVVVWIVVNTADILVENGITVEAQELLLINTKEVTKLGEPSILLLFTRSRCLSLEQVLFSNHNSLIPILNRVFYSYIHPRKSTRGHK